MGHQQLRHGPQGLPLGCITASSQASAGYNAKHPPDWLSPPSATAWTSAALLADGLMPLFFSLSLSFYFLFFNFSYSSCNTFRLIGCRIISSYVTTRIDFIWTFVWLSVYLEHRPHEWMQNKSFWDPLAVSTHTPKKTCFRSAWIGRVWELVSRLVSVSLPSTWNFHMHRYSTQPRNNFDQSDIDFSLNLVPKHVVTSTFCLNTICTLSIHATRDEKDGNGWKPHHPFTFSHFITGNKTRFQIVGNENGNEINGRTKTNGNRNIKRSQNSIETHIMLMVNEWLTHKATSWNKLM